MQLSTDGPTQLFEMLASSPKHLELLYASSNAHVQASIHTQRYNHALEALHDYRAATGLQRSTKLICRITACCHLRAATRGSTN